MEYCPEWTKFYIEESGYFTAPMKNTFVSMDHKLEEEVRNCSIYCQDERQSQDVTNSKIIYHNNLSNQSEEIREQLLIPTKSHKIPTNTFNFNGVNDLTHFVNFLKALLNKKSCVIVPNRKLSNEFIETKVNANTEILQKNNLKVILQLLKENGKKYKCTIESIDNLTLETLEKSLNVTASNFVEKSTISKKK